MGGNSSHRFVVIPRASCLTWELFPLTLVTCFKLLLLRKQARDFMHHHYISHAADARAGDVPGASVCFHRFPLRDGRRLAWSEFGITRGFPIFYLHAAGSSRLEAAFFDAEARRAGYRLLAVDRPGLGESDSHAGMSRASCTDDLLQLADHLGLLEFGILSAGEGTGMALAVAAMAPERVKLVLGVSSQLPVCRAREALGCRMLRKSLATVLQGILALRLTFANSTPEQYLCRLSESLAYADRRLLGDPAIRFTLTQSTYEAVRHGVSGVARDTALALAPLNVSAASLAMPVHVWLGAVEHLGQYSSVPSFIDSLPQGVLHRLCNHGRYFFWRYSENVFVTATRLLKAEQSIR